MYKVSLPATHIMEYLKPLVAADGVNLVTIVHCMVAELVLNSKQLGTGLQTKQWSDRKNKEAESLNN